MTCLFTQTHKHTVVHFDFTLTSSQLHGPALFLSCRYLKKNVIYHPTSSCTGWHLVVIYGRLIDINNEVWTNIHVYMCKILDVYCQKVWKTEPQLPQSNTGLVTASKQVYCVIVARLCVFVRPTEESSIAESFPVTLCLDPANIHSSSVCLFFPTLALFMLIL